MAHPEVHWRWTPSHLTLLPEAIPPVLPSPVGEGNLRAPFGIDHDLYNFVLRPEIPIAVASIYMLLVLNFNAYNRRRNSQPWKISRTPEFRYFVIAHNIFLALYSFATFIAMGRAASRVLPSWDEEHWNVKATDAFCKLHGPRGLGDAATFNTTINIWEVKNTAIHLTSRGVPDPTDVGRLWNEGLAFWGWFFYVSKFYEVIDTFIVLAKGKRSATLQTYHHAGAMLCMWAGIRYMSPPIWMFVFVNSGIHALMYTYYSLSALGYRVPQNLKRTLTMLQIGQFVWGASYAAAHLFIQYDIPIDIPYNVMRTFQRAASSVQSAAHSVPSAVSAAIASPPAATAIGAFIKKLLLRAAGDGGVAERVSYPHGDGLFPPTTTPIIGNAAGNAAQKAQQVWEQTVETRYRTDWTRINCIDTTGEAFAIYLNLIYLSPLTWLFLRFFSRAYLQRSRARSGSQTLHEVAEAARDARRQAKQAVERAGKDAEDEVAKRGSQAEAEVKKDVQRVKESLREGKVQENVKQTASNAARKAETYAEKAKSTAKDAGKRVEESSKNISGSVKSTSTSQTSSSTTSSTFERSESSATFERGGGGLFRRSWAEDTEESEGKQDANLEASQPLRPDPEVDADAMGNSGVRL